MTEREELIRDIETLKESVRLDWLERAHESRPKEQEEIKARIDACLMELNTLIKLLRELKSSN